MLVFAHGIVGRADLPIPEAVFAAAAAGVLVVSFVALAALWSEPRLQRWPERRLLRLPLAVDVALGLLGVLVFGVTAYAGLAGTPNESENLAPWMVYVAFWVGVPCASLLIGDAWRLLSPWRAIGRATGWLAGRFGSRELPAPLAYPERLGRWPAAAGVAAFGICELCWATASEPAPLAVPMLAYAVAMLVGMSLYGVEAWTRNADAFGVYFGMFAALAPLARRDGVLVARPPVVGAGLIDGRVAGTAAVLLAGIGVTAFDGASEGPLFNDLLPDLHDFFAGLGFGPSAALELGFTTGLLAAVGIIALIWVLARPGKELAHSLAPILAAHVVAHYFLATRVQRPGRRAARVGPARRRLRPVRHGRRRDRLRRRVGHDDLVRAGRGARGRPRRRAGARTRPRARDPRQPSRRDPLPARHAGADGVLHVPWALAAVGGERMSPPPLAHAGHWLAQIAYLAPLVLLVVLLVLGKLRARRDRRRNAGVTDA